MFFQVRVRSKVDYDIYSWMRFLKLDNLSSKQYLGKKNVFKIIKWRHRDSWNFFLNEKFRFCDKKFIRSKQVVAATNCSDRKSHLFRETHFCPLSFIPRCNLLTKEHSPLGDVSMYGWTPVTTLLIITYTKYKP